MLKRFGRFCHDRRWLVLVVWIAALIAVGGASGVVGGSFAEDSSLPGAESERGIEILDEHFGGQGAGYTANIVFEAAGPGATDPGVVGPMEAFLSEVAALDNVTVVSPYSEAGASQISPDREIAFASLEMPADLTYPEAVEVGEQIIELAPELEGVQIEYGGDLFAPSEPPQSEVLGVAFAIVVLIVAFGSVLAMGLPIATALAGIGMGFSLMALLSNVLPVSEIATTVGVMIGLGVGIDYALFIVTRYRDGLRAGLDPAEATATAINTAGRAVLFAGTTVVISLLGMVLVGVGIFTGIGTGAAATVAVTMIASVTLLPALLGFAGHRVELTRWRGLIAAGLVALALVGVGLSVDALLVALPAAAVVLVAGFVVGPLRAAVPRRAAKPLSRTLPYRWSRTVQRHPWASVVVGVGVLAVLSVPVLSMRLGFSDNGNLPADTTGRKAYDLLAEGFGPGFNRPIVVAATLPDGYDPANLEAVTASLGTTDGVALATPAIADDPVNPTAVLWTVYAETAPQDEATTELVFTLRDDVLPSHFDGSGVETAVTGDIAFGSDFSDHLAARMPVFFGAVLTLSFLLLMTVFRSVLVPLKAVILNLISIGAAYGVIVAIFQWGWAASLLGIGSGPIEPFVPMLLFAIVFGLSMDYEVFLLSRIKEQYDRDGDNARAVADGVATTARVITAAAAIMVVVFGSFLLEDDRLIKLFGIGLAAAIALDATIVRLLLVPATMELLGRWNWWIPRWLDRILPRVQVEGTVDAGLVDDPDQDERGSRIKVGV